jgi:uncharacterized protein HemX
MCNMMDVENSLLGGIYCVIMILIGQFFLLNLILAVIIFSFIKSQKENLAAEIRAFQFEEDQKRIEQENIKKLEDIAIQNPIMAQIVQAHKKMISDTTPIRRKSSRRLVPSIRLTDKALNNLFN